MFHFPKMGSVEFTRCPNALNCATARPIANVTTTNPARNKYLRISVSPASDLRSDILHPKFISRPVPTELGHHCASGKTLPSAHSPVLAKSKRRYLCSNTRRGQQPIAVCEYPYPWRIRAHAAIG